MQTEARYRKSAGIGFIYSVLDFVKVKNSFACQTILYNAAISQL